MRVRVAQAFRPAVAALLLLLSTGLVADQRDRRPASPEAAAGRSVIEAVQRRDDKAFNALLRAKADVNATQPDGATALAWAVHLGHSVDGRSAARLPARRPTTVDDTASRR